MQGGSETKAGANAKTLAGRTETQERRGALIFIVARNCQNHRQIAERSGHESTNIWDRAKIHREERSSTSKIALKIDEN